MIQSLYKHCGIFAGPQILLSVVTLGLLVAYLLAWWRRELLPGKNPWEQTLEPLAGIAVTIGLLGSVYGFIIAFGGFREGLDVSRVVSGLGSAYWTTGVGIVTSLVASLGSYSLSVLNR